MRLSLTGAEAHQSDGRPRMGFERRIRLLFALGGVVFGFALGFTAGFYSAGALFKKLMNGIQGAPTLAAGGGGVARGDALPVPRMNANAATTSLLEFNAVLEDAQGHSVPLSTFRGKVVFINVWATYCQPCIAELPALETLYASFEGHRDFAFVSISRDSATTLRGFLHTRTLRFPVYRFAPGSDISGLGTAVPVTLIVDHTGAVVSRIFGAANWADRKFIEDLRIRIDQAAAPSASATPSG